MQIAVSKDNPEMRADVNGGAWARE